MTRAASWVSVGAILAWSAGALVASAQTKPEQAPPKEEKGPTVNVPPRGELPRQAEMPNEVAHVDPRGYVIGAEDVLFVRVWQEPNFTGPAFVRPDGKITMPLMGDVQASGLTPSQLSEDLVKRLGEFIRTKPDVIIYVTQVNSKKFFITGEVNRTGSFPLVKPTTVLEALAESGGFREFANKKKVLIIRGNKRLKFNYNEVIKGKNVEQNILLEAGDQILIQ